MTETFGSAWRNTLKDPIKVIKHLLVNQTTQHVHVSPVSSVGNGSRQVPKPLSASGAYAVEYSLRPHDDVGSEPVFCPSGNIH